MERRGGHATGEGDSSGVREVVRDLYADVAPYLEFDDEREERDERPGAPSAPSAPSDASGGGAHRRGRPRRAPLTMRRRAAYDRATVECVGFYATSVSVASRGRAARDPTGPGLRGLTVRFHARRVGAQQRAPELVQLTARQVAAIGGAYLARAVEYMRELVATRAVALAEFPPALRAAFVSAGATGATSELAATATTGMTGTTATPAAAQPSDLNAGRQSFCFPNEIEA